MGAGAPANTGAARAIHCKPAQKLHTTRRSAEPSTRRSSPEARCRTDSSTGKQGPSLQGTGAAAVQHTHEDSNTANGIADKVFTDKPALKNCKYLPEIAVPPVGAASAANTGAAGAMLTLNSSPPKQNTQAHDTTATRPKAQGLATSPKKPTTSIQSWAVPIQLAHAKKTCQSPQAPSLHPYPASPDLIHEIRKKHFKPSMTFSSQPSPFSSFKT